MMIAKTSEQTRERPLRLWPGVVAVVLQWLLWVGVPLVMPGTIAGYIAAFGALICGLLVVVWWTFFSRAPWSERLGAVGLMIVALFATSRILHESIATGGQGFIYFVYAIPVLCLAFVVWAVAGRRLSDGPRRVAMVATIVLACGTWALLRTDGTSSISSEFSWRWSQSPEERLLAEAGDEPTTLPAVLVAPGELTTGKKEAEWPGFRGPGRDGIMPGVRIETDWTQSPPVELWRRPIGPGWSSFAVHGNLLYTQEQRGDDEIVACYNATTGEPVWRHRDAARFWESNAGAGPRATPSLSDGRVYTLGATGILNVLDAGDGTVLWSRDVATDANAEVPIWGFSGSPLVVEDVVVVAAAGQLVAYDLATGDRRWLGPTGGGGYSSPHLATIDGVTQVLMMSQAGAISVTPADGTVLWEHAWPGVPIVQPALMVDGDVLLSVSAGSGMRRLAVRNAPDGWTMEERWTSGGLKPYFSDFAVHEGHAFGFDGRILAAIDLEDGERRWKGGRYGQGQLVLLPDQDLLLVVSEKGELALVAATPDRFTELARFPAIEGKTWNHPVLVDDLLLLRNSQEMVAFRLSLVIG
jgi:outer membrane protein assembly factor BamB